MKITYLLTWPYAAGGTVRTVITQANAMAAAGHDVEIVGVHRTRERTNFAVDPRVRLETLVDTRVPDALGDEPGTRVPPGEFQYPNFTRRVEDAVAERLAAVDADVLVSTRPALHLLAARYAPSQPVRVAQEHLSLGVHRDDVRAALLDALPTFDAVVTLTEQDRAAYRDALCPGARIERIPNPVADLDVPAADPAARLVVAAGRLGRQKRFDRLILAFEQVVKVRPDWRLRIYGDGPDRRALLRMISERHLYNHVFLMGSTSRLPQEMAKASVFALSSAFEGFPMVLLESLAHGLAVVSFDCPTGPGEMLTHEHDGLLVPPADVDALAASLRRAVEDEPLRRRLGANARDTVRRYASDTIRADWEALLAELLEARQPSN